MSDRLLVEPGLRVEHDGVVSRTNVSPRLNLVARMGPDDAGVLRGGVGVFYDRTPLNVAAFESFETATVTRFAGDGVTPLSPPVAFVHRSSNLRTPRSTVWNVEYDHRIRPNVLLKMNHLRRVSTDLAIVMPIESGRTAELRLDSHGLARYAETEITLRVGTTDLQQLAVAYVRSHATANLNGYDRYFGTFRNPIVRPDEYSLAPDDVPNRVFVRGVVSFGDTWTMSAVGEVRNGFPYSRIDADRQFVGQRNTGGRFPTQWTIDAAVTRTVRFLNRPVQIGLRGYHLLDTFMPRDVQNNVDSPAFGEFYNTIPRRLSATVTFFSR